MNSMDMEQQQLAMASNVAFDDHIHPNSLNLIGGLDDQGTSDHQGSAALAVLSWPDMAVVHTETSRVWTQIP